MNYEVKYAMKHGERCPYCQQVRHACSQAEEQRWS